MGMEKTSRSPRLCGRTRSKRRSFVRAASRQLFFAPVDILPVNQEERREERFQSKRKRKKERKTAYAFSYEEKTQPPLWWPRAPTFWPWRSHIKLPQGLGPVELRRPNPKVVIHSVTLEAIRPMARFAKGPHTSKPKTRGHRSMCLEAMTSKPISRPAPTASCDGRRVATSSRHLAWASARMLLLGRHWPGETAQQMQT